MPSNMSKLDRKLIESSPLKQNLKEILVLREVDGKTNSEVAELLKKDPSTTSGQYTEAKKKIGEWLQSQGPAAQMERVEGKEQAEVFRWLQKNTPLTQIAIETGLPEEKVARYADAYVRLTEKQMQISPKLGGMKIAEAETPESEQLMPRVKKLIAFIEREGSVKAQNCKYAGKDRYCVYWGWPTEPAELSRNPKKGADGLYHVQATSLMCGPCHAFLDRRKKPKN
jgi:hypothetical protein